MHQLSHDPLHPSECDLEHCEAYENGQPGGHHVATPQVWQGLGYWVTLSRVQFQDVSGGVEPWEVRLLVQDTTGAGDPQELTLYPRVAEEIGMCMRREALTAAAL